MNKLYALTVERKLTILFPKKSNTVSKKSIIAIITSIQLVPVCTPHFKLSIENSTFYLMTHCAVGLGEKKNLIDIN